MFMFLTGNSKGNTITVWPYYRPRDFQDAEATGFRDSRRMKVVRLTVLPTGRFHASGNIPDTYFC
jgi:hypothetical protein